MNGKIMTGIYCIENLINHKKYIGQAQDIYSRWKKHIWKLNNNCHHNRYLQNAWNKYGEDSFKFNIIEICNIEKLSELEVYYIDKLNTYFKNNGYNLTLGGEGTRGHVLSDEIKEIIGSYHKGKTISQEHRKNLSNQFSGEGNPFYGIKHTDETKKLISKKHKESGHSKGGNNIKAKKVFCNGMIFDCAQACADYYNIKSCTLRSWIRGDRPMPEEFKNMSLSYI